MGFEKEMYNYSCEISHKILAEIDESPWWRDVLSRPALHLKALLQEGFIKIDKYFKVHTLL